MGIFEMILWGIVIFFSLIFLLSILLIIEKRIDRRKLWERMEAADRKHFEDPSLLRGQDYLAAIWYDRIKGNKSPDPVLEYKLVAVATFLEREAGRFYFDGRPVQQGWMTEKDIEDYINYILRHGDSKFRYEVFLRGKRFGHRNGRVRRLERAMDRWLAMKNRVVAHPVAPADTDSGATEENNKKDVKKSVGELIETMIAER